MESSTARTIPLRLDTWACDFLQLCDMMHAGVTRVPTEQWTARQFREVKPFGAGLLALIRDRDTRHQVAFERVAQGADIERVGHRIYDDNVERRVGAGILKADLIPDFGVGHDMAFAEGIVDEGACVVGVERADIGLALPV